MPSSNGHRSQSWLCPFRGADGRRWTVRDICVPSVASARGDFYARTPFTYHGRPHVRGPGPRSRRAWEHQVNFRRQNGSCFGARLAAGLMQSPRVRTRIGSLRSGHAGGPSEWCCRVGGSKSLCFLIHPYHTVVAAKLQPARLAEACPSEAISPRGPAT